MGMARFLLPVLIGSFFLVGGEGHLLGAVPPPVQDLECGKYQVGGRIQAGRNAGAGATCEAAKADLDDAMGVVKPSCPECPQGATGCKPHAFIAPGCGIFGATCVWVHRTQTYVATARIPTGGCLWHQLCTQSLYVVPQD